MGIGSRSLTEARRMWEAVGRWRVEPALGCLKLSAPATGRWGGIKDKANIDRPLLRPERHSEFISHINHFSQSPVSKSSQKDWNGIMLRHAWEYSPRAIENNKRSEAFSSLQIYAWEKCTQRPIFKGGLMCPLRKHKDDDFKQKTSNLSFLFLEGIILYHINM